MVLAARLGALLAVAFAAGGAHTVHGYGLSLTIPNGWDGKITHGLVRLNGPGLRIEIRETSEPTTRSDPFFRRAGVPKLRASDFRSREHHLGFTVADRRFALLPLAAHPSQQTIDAANAALRTFVVKRGTYYG